VVKVRENREDSDFFRVRAEETIFACSEWEGWHREMNNLRQKWPDCVVQEQVVSD